MYALATIQVEQNQLEYTCEIQLDFSSLLKSEPTSVKLEQTFDKILFGSTVHALKLNENLPANSTVYRFIALHHSHLEIDYRMAESNRTSHFTLDRKTGLLASAQRLDRESLGKGAAILMQVVACVADKDEECAETQVCHITKLIIII